MNQNVKQRPTGEKRKRRLPLYSLVLIGCLAAVGLFAGLSARYVHLHSDTDAALAQHFYFTSDVLGTPVAGGGVSSDNTYTLRAGVDQIDIVLYNTADDLRTSEVDIDYTVTIGDAEGNAVAGQGAQSGTITVADGQAAVSFKGLASGTYTVTANATKPYTATLVGQFTVVAETQGLSYAVTDGGEYIIVTVSSAGEGGTVTLKWDSAKLIPDETNSVLRNASGSVNITLDKYSSGTYRFFKQTSDTYNTSKTAITGTEVTIGG